MKKFVVFIIFLFFSIISVNASIKANTIRELRSELSALKETKKKNDNAKAKTQSEINASCTQSSQMD